MLLLLLLLLWSGACASFDDASVWAQELVEELLLVEVGVQVLELVPDVVQVQEQLAVEAVVPQKPLV